MLNKWNDSSKMKKYALFCFASLFMAMVVSAVADQGSNPSRKTAKIHRQSKLVIRKTAINIICATTDYKADCATSLANVRSPDPRTLIRAAFDIAIIAIRAGVDKGLLDLRGKADADVRTRDALNTCRELMDSAIDDLQKTREKFRGFLFIRFSDFVEDLRIWLSGSITYQQTCIDGFEGIDSEAAVVMERVMRRGQHLTSNGLAIASDLDNLLKAFRIPFLSPRRGGILGLGSSQEPPMDSSSETAPQNTDSVENSSTPTESALSGNQPSQTENPSNNGSPSVNQPTVSENPPTNASPSVNQQSDTEVKPPEFRNGQAGSLEETPTNADSFMIRPLPTLQKDSSEIRPPENTKEQPSDSSQDNTKNADSSVIRPLDPIGTLKNLNPLNNRHLKEELKEEFPPWLELHSRRLLQARRNNIRANVVVAKDGSGKCKTIAQALAMVPKNNRRKFVIHIKQGVYKEMVDVSKKMLNVMFVGDGPTKTIITGNVAFLPDRIGTYRTATVAVNGDNFMAKDIGFENTAGAARHQAVALRVSADFAVFFNCRMDGYQDTLYVHTHRQFYRDCRISGTIDFIFGDAKAVFQNCEFVIRRPMDNQQCIVTAQGRKDRRETTGIVIHNSRIIGDPAYRAVKAKNRAFLGRPWKEYSRTIIMNTMIDDVIDPEGWLKWNETFALNTLFYSEYRNSGRGSGQGRRVKWRGIKRISDRDAKQFAPGTFLRGNTWIPQTRIPYNAN